MSNLPSEDPAWMERFHASAEKYKQKFGRFPSLIKSLFEENLPEMLDAAVASGKEIPDEELF